MIRKKGTIIILCFFVANLLAISCATTKKITTDVAGKGGRLKKKVAFLPTLNNTGYGGEAFQESARMHFKSFLEHSCNDLMIIDSQKARNLLAQISYLPSGQIDNLALSKVGRALGLNAILEEGLSELECVSDKRGIWGFRDTCMLVQLSVSVRAYDVETGAVLFDEIVQDEIEVSEHEWHNIKERRRYNKEMADHLLAKTIPEIGERVCDLVGDMPWKGYITSIAKNTFALTAGTDVGLVEGDILEVFGNSGAIRCNTGQSYLVPGPKIGELLITRVHRNRAKAIGNLGNEPRETSHVKLKR